MADFNGKIRPIIQGLAVEASYEFPIEKLKSVRTQASELSAILDRRFTTWTDRERRIIAIKRTK